MGEWVVQRECEFKLPDGVFRSMLHVYTVSRMTDAKIIIETDFGKIELETDRIDDLRIRGSPLGAVQILLHNYSERDCRIIFIINEWDKDYVKGIVKEEIWVQKQ